MDIENEGTDPPQENPNKNTNKKRLPLLTARSAQNKTADLPLFEDHVFVFVPYGVQLTKKRIEILRNLCIKQKVEVIDLDFFTWEEIKGKRVFIIINKEMKWDHLEKLVRFNYVNRISDFNFVDCEWISMSFQKKQNIDPTPYTVVHPSKLAAVVEPKKEPLPQETKELAPQSNRIIDEITMEYLEPEGVALVRLPVKFTNLLSQKMFALMKASKELFDYSYEKKVAESKLKETKPAPEIASVVVEEEQPVPVAKEEDTKNWRKNYYDEELIFLEPKPINFTNPLPADNPQPSSLKKEDIKDERALKSEPPGFDPMFFGDEDVHVSKAIDLRKEFRSEKDLEGTIIEGIKDFSHVNKSLEGIFTEVKEPKILNPGQRGRDSLWNSKKEKFTCFIGSNKENPNALIISELENVLKSYSNLQDRGRIIGYNKAIASIKCYHKKIETEEDLNQIPDLGEKTKQKIREILKTGSLRQARVVENDVQHKTLTLFSNIWGTGTGTAKKWYNMGFRTLEDLKRHPEVLNKDQALGVKYFEDFQKRIPRAEVEEIVKRVRQKVEELSDIKGIYEMIPCGSYRRGKASSGDVDLLMMRKDGGSTQGFVYKLIKSLEDELITDHLTMPSVGHYGSEMYMGWCMLKEVGIHRRIDIKMYPREQFAFAVLYFTGSKNFNRSMRLFARNKGYTLSDHTLVPTNIVNNENVWKGKGVVCFTEEDVFKALGLEYKPPEERDLG